MFLRTGPIGVKRSPSLHSRSQAEASGLANRVQSLLHDEGFSASTVLRSWGSLVSLSIEHEANGQPPSHPTSETLTPIGESEAVLRSFSAICLIALSARHRRRSVSSSEPPRRCHRESPARRQRHSRHVHAVRTKPPRCRCCLLASQPCSSCWTSSIPRNTTIVGWAACLVLLSYSASIVGILLVGCHIASLWFLPAGQRLIRRRGITAGIVMLTAVPLALLIYSHNEGQAGISKIRPGVSRDIVYTLTGHAGSSGWWRSRLSPSSRHVSRFEHRQRELRRERRLGAGLLACWSVLPTIALVILSPVNPLIGRYLLSAAWRASLRLPARWP